VPSVVGSNAGRCGDDGKRRDFSPIARRLAAAGTLRCAFLLRASPGCPSMATRSVGRSNASSKDATEPLCLGWHSIQYVS